MDQLYQKAIDNVKRFEESQQKHREVNLEKAKQYFRELLFKDIQTKVEKASLSGRTQILLYRINFRRENRMNWARYYSNEYDIREVLTDYGLLEELEEYYRPFKVRYEPTSHRNNCIFIYWRDEWDDDSDDDEEFDEYKLINMDEITE